MWSLSLILGYKPGPGETWQVSQQCSGSWCGYAFKSWEGKGYYMVAEANGDLNANRPGAGPWEIFQVIHSKWGFTVQND